MKLLTPFIDGDRDTLLDFSLQSHKLCQGIITFAFKFELQPSITWALSGNENFCVCFVENVEK